MIIKKINQSISKQQLTLLNNDRKYKYVRLNCIFNKKKPKYLLNDQRTDSINLAVQLVQTLLIKFYSKLKA